MNGKTVFFLSMLLICITLLLMYWSYLEFQEKLAYIGKGYIEQIHKVKPDESGSFTYWVKPKEINKE